MTYQKKVTVYQPTDLSQKEVMSVADAARALNMTMPGVIRAIERGVLTEIVDDEASYHNRRLLLRSEVERLAQAKQSTESSRRSEPDCPEETPCEEAESKPASQSSGPSSLQPEQISRENHEKSSFSGILSMAK